MATGALDAQGVWQYGPDDPASPTPDLLNLGMASVSAQLAAVRNPVKVRAVLTGSTTANADATERVIARTGPPAETLSVTLATEAGREYRIEFQGRCQSSVAGDRLQVAIRRTNLAGVIVYQGMMMPGAGGVGQTLYFVTFDSPGAGTTTWVATFARAGGTGSALISATATTFAHLSARVNT